MKEIPLKPWTDCQVVHRGEVMSAIGSNTKHVSWGHSYGHPQAFCGVLINGRNLDTPEANKNKTGCKQCKARLRSDIRDIEKDKKEFLEFIDSLK